jgi:AraC family transcriptional regulator
VSIGTYVRALRVKHAKELLPKRSLVEVALACGFADQSHFTRTFRRIEGMTPTEFRRSLTS